MKSWIEISGARLSANWRAIQAVADAEVLAVVKADAYGHGAAICAPLLAEAGAHWLGVTGVDEGVAVRNALGASSAHILPTGILATRILTPRILVMCGMEPPDAEGIVANRLTPVVWTPEHVAALEQAARALGQQVRVHVEVDTGMARQGAAAGPALRGVLQRIATSPWVVCEGVMTHLCCSEVPGAATTARAQRLFEDALHQVSAAGQRPELVHVENTSAVDVGETAPWLSRLANATGARPMVRIGIGLYGYCLQAPRSSNRGQPARSVDAGPHHRGALRGSLQPVMTWKTHVLDVREVGARATVGYGAGFVAKENMRLALLPVGYADGFRREASSGIGNGWVMIAGRRAPVVGRVSMNLTVVDVSAMGAVAAGAEVVLLGNGVSADDHARWAETIPYEILCGVRGPRTLAS